MVIASLINGEEIVNYGVFLFIFNNGKSFNNSYWLGESGQNLVLMGDEAVCTTWTVFSASSFFVAAPCQKIENTQYKL